MRWLPPDGPLARSLDPDGIGAGWTPTNNLLALATEVADVTNVILMKVYSESGATVRNPIEIDRPARRRKDKPVMASGAEAEGFAAIAGAAVVKDGKKVTPARKPHKRDPNWYPRPSRNARTVKDAPGR